MNTENTPSEKPNPWEPRPIKWDVIEEFLETIEGFPIDRIATFFNTTEEIIRAECLEKYKIDFDSFAKKHQELGKSLKNYMGTKMAVSGDRSLLIELRRKIEAESKTSGWD